MPQFVKTVCPKHGEQIHRLLDHDDPVPFYECLLCAARRWSIRGFVLLVVALAALVVFFALIGLQIISIASLILVVIATFCGIVAVTDLAMAIVCYRATNDRVLWEVTERLS